jgi:hypothetical protein
LAFLLSLISPKGDSRLYKRADSASAPAGKSELISLIRFGLPLELESRSGTCVHLMEDASENPFAASIETALAKEPDELIETWWKGLSGGGETEASAERIARPPAPRRGVDRFGRGVRRFTRLRSEIHAADH